jgi:hypothetical protein
VIDILQDRMNPWCNGRRRTGKSKNVWMEKNCKADESNLKTDGYVWILFLNRSRLGNEFFENIEKFIQNLKVLLIPSFFKVASKDEV